jgi:hypothetical protein
MLLTARMDTEKTNQSVTDGTLGKTIQGIMEQLKPEAAYFTATGGDRTCLMVFDLADSSGMPLVAEPFFQAGAKVTLSPVMNAEDLETGLASLGR